MIQSADLFHLPFYKKSPYSGSLNGMRFYIEKSQENDTDIFKVWIFPGPLCFEKTDEQLKRSHTFAFTEESIPLIAEWLNEQYANEQDYWKKHRSFFDFQS